jgi:hypothetical protein
MSKRTITIINKDRSLAFIKDNFKVLFEKYPDEICIVNMPGTISSINNRIIKDAKATGVDFVHIFHDDLIINQSFDIEKYEKFITEYKLGYYFNPRLSPLNYIYNLIAPRLVINAEKYTKASINVYAFDSKEYIIIDCKNNNELFNEELKYLYNIEYIYRCNKANILPFLNFYFDNSEITDDMVRDDKNFPRKTINHAEYLKEEEMLANKHNVQWVPHTNADDAINYFRNIKGV